MPTFNPISDSDIILVKVLKDSISMMNRQCPKMLFRKTMMLMT